MENTAGMEGTVRGLYVFRERGQPGEPAECALFQKDKGMEGDRHATGGERQVTLLSGEVREWMNAQPQPGLCFRRYKANLETEGLDTAALRPGMVLRAGTACFRVSGAGKECFPECALFREGEACRLSSGAVFLTVSETGMVLKNDKIKVTGGVSL